ncbi:MAG: hypothetical protein U0271_13025 [Polyangiaceae bacterium]
MNIRAILGSGGVLLRRVIFLTATLVGLTIALTAPLSSELNAVAVPFVLAIATALFPLFWNEVADPFELASYNGVYTGLGLVSSLVAIVDAGKIDFKYLPGLSPRSKEELAAVVVWAYVVANTSYLVGYYLPRKSTAAPRWLPRVHGYNWSTSRLLIVTLVCMAVAIPVYAFFQNQLGAELTDITQMQAAKAVWRDDQSRSWILRGIMLGLVPTMFMIALASRERRNLPLLILAAIALVEGILIVRTGQRSLTVNFFVSCACIFHYIRRRLPVMLLIVAGFFALATSNVLLDYRVSSDDRTYTPISAQRFEVNRVFSEHEQDRQRLSTMAVVMDAFPEKQEFLLGESWLAIIAMPIPRWLWPEKVSHFEWRDTLIMVNLAQASIPTPFHGVLYANFSWFGVVLGSLLWGRFQRRVYDWLLANPKDPSVVVLYANAIFVTAPILLPLLYLTQFLLPMYLFILFMGMRNTAFSPRASAASILAKLRANAALKLQGSPGK